MHRTATRTAHIRFGLACVVLAGCAAVQSRLPADVRFAGSSAAEPVAREVQAGRFRETMRPLQAETVSAAAGPALAVVCN